MTTIVILAIFLMAASATPIQEASNRAEDQSPGPLVPLSDTSPNQPGMNSTVKSPTVTSEGPTPPKDTNPDCNFTNRADYQHRVHPQCTLICGGDEVIALTDNETCILPPPNGTGDIPGIGEYYLEYANKTGVCFDGECRPRSTEAPAAPTGSSPGTTTTTTTTTATTTTTTSNTIITTTTTETGDAAASPVIEGVPGMTAKTTNDSKPLPESLPPQDTHTGSNGNSEDPASGVGSTQEEKASSTVADAPVSLSGNFSAMP